MAASCRARPSTVVDLRRYEETGMWSIVRVGAVSERRCDVARSGSSTSIPRPMPRMIRATFRTTTRSRSRRGGERSRARSILELGTGTGETALRLLEHHPGATLVGIDGVSEMLELARRGYLPSGSRCSGAASGPAPRGEFDLVASALCVHHLDGEKADLFLRSSTRLLRAAASCWRTSSYPPIRPTQDD